MTGGRSLRDLGKSEAALRAESEAKRQQMIRNGRAWLHTYMDHRAPWGFDDECCFHVARMLNAGRDGMDVRNYVARCNRYGSDLPA